MTPIQFVLLYFSFIHLKKHNFVFTLHHNNVTTKCRNAPSSTPTGKGSVTFCATMLSVTLFGQSGIHMTADPTTATPSIKTTIVVFTTMLFSTTYCCFLQLCRTTIVVFTTMLFSTTYCCFLQLCRTTIVTSVLLYST